MDSHMTLNESHKVIQFLFFLLSDRSSWGDGKETPIEGRYRRERQCLTVSLKDFGSEVPVFR